MSNSLATLAQEYRTLWETCQVLPDHEHHPISHLEVAAFGRTLMNGRARYEEVERTTRVPWYVVGLIHGMECDFSFHEHLHNGDPLTARTVQVPAGRPRVGSPPFPWLVSAIDALEYDNFIGWPVWDVAGICFKLEGYNGFGSRARGIHTPYLWSGSNHYSEGKYVADGVWNSEAVSRQVGAAVALKYLVETGAVTLPAAPAV